MTEKELWEAVLAQIQLQLSPANFGTWFKGTKIASLKNQKAVITTPNSFVKEWLEQKYKKVILKILHNLNPEIKELSFIIEKQSLRFFSKKKKKNIQESQLEFLEFKIDKNTNLNPRYTFKNFVVGSFNELTYAAAQAVIKSPGTLYNPLFIYGGVGLGKTHLLQATGNEIFNLYPEKRIRYIPAERFTQELVRAIKNQEMESFKSRYQEIDVLIIDDIQFLAGKEKTQEEFFHLFNSLYQRNKQIVLSSDRPPKTIPSLTERLRSRFEGGMIGDISFPDFETRVAILKVKASEKEIDFPEEIYHFIAENIQKNIRDLEGALNRLIVYYKLNNRPPDLKAAKQLLKKTILGSKQHTTPKKILSVVADFYDLTEKDLLSPSRKKEVAKPRQIVMYLLKTELKSSYLSIARRLGGRDHSTIIYGCEKIAKQLEEDKKLEEEIELIKQRIYSG